MLFLQSLEMLKNSHALNLSYTETMTDCFPKILNNKLTFYPHCDIRGAYLASCFQPGQFPPLGLGARGSSLTAPQRADCHGQCAVQ